FVGGKLTPRGSVGGQVGRTDLKGSEADQFVGGVGVRLGTVANLGRAPETTEKKARILLQKRGRDTHLVVRNGRDAGPALAIAQIDSCLDGINDQQLSGPEQLFFRQFASFQGREEFANSL